MSTEFEIRLLMRKPMGIEKKAEKICEIVAWDREKLIKSMEEHSTFTTENRSKIIGEFWHREVRYWPTERFK